MYEQLQSSLQERYVSETERDKDVENKSHRFIFLTTILLPLSNVVEMEHSLLMAIPTMLIGILFFGMLRVRTFKVPETPAYYLDCCGKINDNLSKALKLTDEQISKKRIESYIICTVHNKKITDQKIKYLKNIQYITFIQILSLGILFSLSNLGSMQGI